MEALTLMCARSNLAPMRTPPFAAPAFALVLVAMLAGCSAGPHTGSSGTPPAAPPAAASASGETRVEGFNKMTGGAADSVGSIPGSAYALYRYRFRQIDPPSDRFYFQDRELSFYFKPAPDALFFQVENRTDKPVWLDWDKCMFTDALGATARAAHSTTTVRERYGTQASIQILGLQRYGDFIYSMDYLIEQGGDTPLHRPLLPEDESAPQFSGREFATELAFRVDGQPRTYSFRFKILSVLPNK
jgi:hypothetical protein